MASVREWPPVYSEEELDETIARIIKSANAGQFYENTSDTEPLQGDIIELDAEVPVIADDGVASTDGDSKYWLVLANTCDLSRKLDEVTYVSVAPLTLLADLNPNEGLKNAIRRYETSRIFLVPGWDNGLGEHYAEFTRIVSLHRVALASHAKIRARLCLETWTLLNACLVRLFCRADGRNT